jgi:hypothetical protein
VIPFGAIGAAVGGIGSIIGGMESAKAAKSAASTQQNAFNQGIGFQQQVYGQGQQNLNPFIGAGQSALQSLLGFYGLPGGNASGASQGFSQFQQTPFYQFPLQQSTLATNRALAASGLIGSGGQLRDLSQLNAGYASAALPNYLGGIGNLVTGGQDAATSLLSGGNKAAGTLLQGYTGQGNAQAAGIVGSNNALQQGIQNGLIPITNSLFGSPNTSGTGYAGGAVPGTGGFIGNNGLIGRLTGLLSGSGGGGQTQGVQGGGYGF